MRTDEKGDATRGIGVGQKSMKSTRVRNTREKDMIIILGSNDAKITLADKRFVCIVKVGFLNKEEVWGKVGNEVSKICWS